MRVGLVFLLTIFYFWANISIALEENSYRVITANQIYEIREYDDRLAVQTRQKNGQNGAFRKLFKYISGSNISSTKIEMTTPVTPVSYTHLTLPTKRIV